MTDTRTAVPNRTLDPGASGPAALARPRSLEQVYTGDKSTGREKADAIRYHDAHPLDHYQRGALLTDRQIDAGWRLTTLYGQGFSAMVALPSYGNREGGELGEIEDQVRSSSRREYCRLADLIPHSARHAMACVVRGEFPTMTFALAYLKSACDVIADELDLPREGV